MMRRSLLLARLALLTLAAACSGGSDSPTPPVVASSIAVSPLAVSLVTGATATVTATVTGSNGQPMPGAAVAWSSESPTVASVSGAGSSATITAVAAGSALVRATSGSATAVVQVTVANPVVPQSITVTPATLGLFVGAAGTVTASVTGNNGQPMPQAPITWTSDRATVATVSGSGATATITGVATGVTSIRATAGTVSATVAVTVQLPVARVAITLNGSLLKGDSAVATAVPQDASNNPIVGRTVTWSSTGPTVASVSPGGVVLGVGRGAAWIRATVDGRTDSARVTVSGVISVFITPDTLTLRAGTTRGLLANITLDQGVPGGVSWRSQTPSIATVNASGLVTAVAPGTGLIELRSQFDTAMRDTAFVTVPDPCRVPIPLTLGTPHTDSFTTSDCAASRDIYSYSVAAPSVVRFSVSGTDSIQVYPVASTVGVGPRLGQVLRTAYAVVSPGSHTAWLQLRDSTQIGRPYTLTAITLPSVPNCVDGVIAMRGTTFTQGLDNACPTSPRSGSGTPFPTVSFWVRVDVGQVVRVQATAGYALWMEAQIVGSNPVVASGSAPNQTVTLTTPVSPNSGVYIVRLSSVTGGTGGPITITIDP